MALIEVIFEENGAEKVASAVAGVDSSVTKLKGKLKSPLGVNFDTNAFTTKSKTITDSFQHMGIEYDKVSRKMKSPLGTGDSMLSAKNFTAAGKGIAGMGQEMEKTAAKSQDLGMKLGFLGRLLAAMAIRKVVHDFIELTDVYTNFQNKLKVQISNPFRLEIATGDIVKIANESRTSIEAVGESFARTMQATKKYGYSQNEAMKFTENLTKAIQVSGATSNEAKNAIIQLGQGMNKGALQGQDLRSVMEFLPFVSEILTDKMAKLTKGTANANLTLKEMAAKGLITTKVVMEALSEATNKINEKFARLVPTIEGATAVLKNHYMVAIGESTQLTEKIAKGLLWLADNFNTVGTAVVAVTTQVVVLYGAFQLFNAGKFLMLNPWVALAALVISATTALVTFKDEINTSGTGFHSLSDTASVVWRQMKKDMLDLITSTKDVKAAMNDMHPDTKDQGGFDWDLYMSAAYDAMRSFNPNVARAQQRLKDNKYGDHDAKLAEADYQQGYRTSYEMEKDRKNAEIRQALAQQAKMEKEKREADEKYKIDLEGAQAKRNAAPASTKAKKEGGKTFGEIIDEASFRADVADEDSLKRRVETKLHQALESLKPSIKKWALELNDEISKAQYKYQDDQSNRDPNAQKNLTETMDKLRAKFGAARVEQELALREQVMTAEQEKDVKALQLKMQKDLVESQKEDVKTADEKLKKELELKAAKLETLRVQREQAAAEKTKFVQSVAEGLDPTIATNRQIADLERFRDIVKDQPRWVEMTNAKIEELRASMTAVGKAGMMFGQQMNSIFGPGGSMVQGIGDAIAGAKDLGDALKQVFASVAKQALSALVQLPLNMALGALQQGMMGPSPGSAPGIVSSLSSNVFSNLGKRDGLAYRDPGQVYTGLPGHAAGGYTGNYGTSTPAGIVHGQEYVVNAEATRKYMPLLETINKGGSVGGGGDSKVVIHNYAGVQVEATNNNGEIAVMITKAIREQTGPIVAQHLKDPSSPVSRSMNRYFAAERQRL